MDAPRVRGAALQIAEQEPGQVKKLSVELACLKLRFDVAKALLRKHMQQLQVVEPPLDACVLELLAHNGDLMVREELEARARPPPLRLLVDGPGQDAGATGLHQALRMIVVEELVLRHLVTDHAPHALGLIK
jgi:hypothetical protein